MRVVELFAGVGGFRIGFESNHDHKSSKDPGFRVIWANQWEPSTNVQHAATTYATRWGMSPRADDKYVYESPQGDVLVNKDIAKIHSNEIPDHDLLCGGFPCQDYSVAKTLNTAKGIAGVKGVLWWEIRRIIEDKRPPVILLENVDRLLKSPTSQRGRDFAVMLASLDELGYSVEWRVIDASAYGFPQRRKRVFILGFSSESPKGKEMTSAIPKEWILDNGALARAFPVSSASDSDPEEIHIWNRSVKDLADVSDSFNRNEKRAATPFMNTGIMVKGTIHTLRTEPMYDGEPKPLGKLPLQTPGRVSDEFILTPDSILREKGWMYLKGSKREERRGRDGFTYRYSEGPVTFPDALEKPSRTIVTGEGGSAPSRFKHVVKFRPTKTQFDRLDLKSPKADEVRKSLGIGSRQWLRRLTPIELERLNGFPDDHTNGHSDSKRAFFMGNALVCGIITRISFEI